MATYTICKRFVSTCAGDAQLARNTLYHFVHDGPLRIAVDAGSKVLNEYKTIAEHNEIIAMWLSLLSYRGPDAWDSVKIEESLFAEELFLEISARCVATKRLVCDSKQDYTDFPVAQKEVVLVDRAEAPGEISTQSIKPVAATTVIATNATFGNNSPIVKGDRNETKIGH